jgi:3,5-dihydroxyphenylacetyl-CoA synthase
MTQAYEIERPRILSIGTANPPTTYTQQDLLRLFKCDNKSVRAFFENSHIEKRHLVLPEPGEDGTVPDEDGTQLLAKHLKWALEIAPQAITRCLSPRGLTPADIDFIAVVSSTGFLCPGLAAYLVEKMDFRRNTHRIDILGMGCNAGMNGLVAVAQFAAANPGKNGLLVCCEICSAAYVFDMTVRTGVVNSLFGDGSAAVLLRADPALGADDGPKLLGFEPHIIHEVRDDMRFDFEKGKFSFYLGWQIPYQLGEQIDIPVRRLLDRFGLKRRDIKQWIVHSGGKKVVDSFKYNIGLTEYDVRHTRSILQHYGNISSASIFFSLQELLREGVVEAGDFGVIMAMGPGVSIETGLMRW